MIQKYTPSKSIKKYGDPDGSHSTILRTVDDPDNIEVIYFNDNALPKGRYRELGFEKRQVFDIDRSTVVTEHRAQVLENDKGKRFVAPFPKGVDQTVQYGAGFKSFVLSMSLFEQIPIETIEEYVISQLHIPIRRRVIDRIIDDAYKTLARFEVQIKERLYDSQVVHVKETPITIEGRKHMLHRISNDCWTLYHPQIKQSTDPLHNMGLIPEFKGVLCHDRWKPYLKEEGIHALCTDHLIDELAETWKIEGHHWTLNMKRFLETLNNKVAAAKGKLSTRQRNFYRVQYRKLVKRGLIESLDATHLVKNGNLDQVEKSNSRHLLDLLKEHENQVLMFMDNEQVALTHISEKEKNRKFEERRNNATGFETEASARMFCRIQSYLTTCEKQGVRSKRALEILFNSELP